MRSINTKRMGSPKGDEGPDPRPIGRRAFTSTWTQCLDEPDIVDRCRDRGKGFHDHPPLPGAPPGRRPPQVYTHPRTRQIILPKLTIFPKLQFLPSEPGMRLLPAR